jgi:vitamin B12 transporter
MQTLTTGLSALALSLFATTALAEAASELDPVVVVASRIEEPVSRVGQSVTVLDASDIRTAQTLSVAELIQTTPGVGLSRTGGPGQPATVFIRGGDGDHTLVLIDGVEMDDPTQPAGNFDFGHLLVGDIDRIEILRGAHSTLWGSQAIGGVVSIETAKPTKTLQGELDLEGGSYSTWNYRAGLGGKEGPLSFRLAGGYDQTDGISAVDTRYGGGATNPYRNTSFSGRAEYQVAPDVKLDLRGYYMSYWSSFDGYDTPTGAIGWDGEFSKGFQYLGYGGLEFPLLAGLISNRVSVQYVDTDRRNIDPNITAGPIETYYGFGSNTKFDYQGSANVVPGWISVFGLQHSRSTLTTDSPAYDFGTLAPVFARAWTDSAYLDLKGSALAGLTIEGGVRYERHSAYGGHATAQASLVQALNGGDTLLRASFGQGFKAPALYQLYSPYGPFAYHLPSLKPEQSNSFDAGVEQRLFERTLVVSATVFHRMTRDLITFYSGNPVAPYGVYANVGRARAEGAELQAVWKPTARFNLSANYTYTRAQDLSAHQDLIRRPRDMANIEAGYTFANKLSTSLALRYSGKTADASYDASYNKIAVSLKSYTVVDLRASYPLTDHVEVYGRIENLFDERYATAYHYAAPGASAYGGLRLKF